MFVGSQGFTAFLEGNGFLAAKRKRPFSTILQGTKA
jgi:hypothetical protein